MKSHSGEKTTVNYIVFASPVFIDEESRTKMDPIRRVMENVSL